MTKKLKAALELSRVVIAGTDQSLRPLFRNAEFQQVDIFKDIQRAVDKVKDRKCDLLIIEDMVADANSLPLVLSVRRNQVGFNPFLPIVALLGSNARQNVQQYIDAGVDDVWSKPLSTAQIVSRVERLVSTDFVYEVGSEYVGPNRPSRGEVSADMLIEVPNVLKMKAEGVQDIDEKISHSVGQVTAQIQRQVVASHGSKISDIIEIIIKNKSRDVRHELNTLTGLADELEERLMTSKNAALAELCIILKATIQDTLNDGTARNFDLLTLIARAVELSAGGRTADIERGMEIVALIKSS